MCKKKVCILNLLSSCFNLFQMICPKIRNCIFYKHTEHKIHEFNLIFCQFLIIYFVSLHFLKTIFQVLRSTQLQVFSKLDYFMMLWFCQHHSVLKMEKRCNKKEVIGIFKKTGQIIFSIFFCNFEGFWLASKIDQPIRSLSRLKNGLPNQNTLKGKNMSTSSVFFLKFYLLWFYNFFKG